MNEFVYYSPTKVIFGKGAESAAGSEIYKLGAKKVLIHYGGGSIVRSGLLDRVLNSLEQSGISYISLSGVKPNPVLSLVRTGITMCREENVDLILAVGGGSAIDSAKAIAVGAPNRDTDVWDYFLKKATPVNRLPVAVILTIAASGSEMSNSCVITNEDGMLKRGFSSDANRPVVSFMNPELLKTVPKYHRGCGVTDILMHTLDRYFTSKLGNELTDQIAEGLLRTVIKYGERYVSDPSDYEAASEIMWAGGVSHNDLTGLGGEGDFATHRLSHELSAMFDKAHGAALSAIWGSWARHVYKNNPARFKRYAQSVWGISNGDDDSLAVKGIEQTEWYFKKIGMPVNIAELIGRPLSEDELNKVSLKCTWNNTVVLGSFKKLDRNECLEIYKKANRA